MPHKKTLEELKREAVGANLNVVVMTFAARHRRKSDKCLGRVARKQNQTQHRWESVFRTTGKANLMALLVKYWQRLCLTQRKGGY